MTGDSMIPAITCRIMHKLAFYTLSNLCWTVACFMVMLWAEEELNKGKNEDLAAWPQNIWALEKLFITSLMGILCYLLLYQRLCCRSTPLCGSVSTEISVIQSTIRGLPSHDTMMWVQIQYANLFVYSRKMMNILNF